MALLGNYKLDEDEIDNDFLDENGHDGWGDVPRRAFPHIEQVKGRNTLSPKPPDDWWAVLRLSPAAGIPQPADLGAWILLLGDIQIWEKARGVGWSHRTKPMHCIAREPDDNRILLVHPDLHSDVHGRLGDFDQAARCDCGDCHLAPDKVEAAMVTIAGRLWNRAGPGERMSAFYHELDNYDIPSDVILQDNAWMQAHGSFWMLHQLAETLARVS